MTQKLWPRPKWVLLVLALAIAIAGAAFGRQRANARAPSPAAPPTMEAYDVARLLAESPPDSVVVLLGDPGRHPLPGATPASLFGSTEDEQVARAPRARRIVLVGADAVRTDRLARRWIASGREVAVLDLESWDVAMDGDPPPPPASADADARSKHARDVALRRALGDRASAPAPVEVLPKLAPASAPVAGARKREGC